MTTMQANAVLEILHAAETILLEENLEREDPDIDTVIRNLSIAHCNLWVWCKEQEAMDR